MEEKNCNEKRFDIHNLTFVRNNSYAQKIGMEKNQHYFFMMDYYNFLLEKDIRREREGYTTLVGTDGGEGNAVAKRVVGIYAEEGHCGSEVFHTASDGQGATSRIPFLGTIQVYITDYLWHRDKAAAKEGAGEYLEAYTEEIEQSLRKVLDKDDDMFRIYRTITAEDFLVVIRTAKFRKIYEAALSLSGVKNASGRRIFFTHSNIGVECVKAEEGKAAAMGTDFVGLNDSVREGNRDVRFLLRFRIEKEALGEIQALEDASRSWCRDDGCLSLEAVYGMVGRYDLVVRLSVDEFMDIYPFLCMNVTGRKIGEVEGGFFCTRLVWLLVDKMSKGIIQTINTRVVMDLYAGNGCGCGEAVSLMDEDLMRGIRARSAKIRNIFKEFRDKYGSRFLTEKYRYEELVHMLNSLMNSYENLAYEVDTHIDWYICSEYLEEVFLNMFSYMEHVDKVPDAIEKFLNEFQIFVSAFDAYLRLLQGMNQNTIQDPRYDISAPIDGQKFIIAYSEFVDRIHKAYCDAGWEKKGAGICREERRSERVIIYPDVTIKNLELTEVFGYDVGTRGEKGVNPNPAVLICKIPIFEYFERPYDLIPLVSHEISHHMLILKREDRNQFLLERIFGRIAAEVVGEIQIRFVKKRYVARGDALTLSLTRSLACALMEDFGARNPGWEQYVFLHLVKKIREYVHAYFAEEKMKCEKLVYTSSGKELEEGFAMLLNEVYEEEAEGRKDGIKDLCRGKALSEAERFQALKKLDIMMEELLKQINLCTIRYNRPITMENLSGNDSKELDAVLVRWVRENGPLIEMDQEINPQEQKNQRLKYYIDLVKRTFLLYAQVSRFQGDAAGERREKLAESLFEKVQKPFKNLLESDYYFVYDQDMAKKAAFWELEKKERATVHFLEAMECLEPDKVKDAIEFGMKEYREACADVIMSRWLGFGSFGYFRMSVTLGPRMQGYSEGIRHGGLQWGRLVVVLAVLMSQENPSVKKEGEEWTEIDLADLRKKIWEYVDDAMLYAEKRIRAAMKDGCKSDEDGIKLNEEVSGKVTETFFEMFRECLRPAREAGGAVQVKWEEGIWDCLCDEEWEFFEPIPEYRKYFQKEVNLFKRIYETLDAYQKVQKNGKLYVETPLFRHMSEVYCNMTGKMELHEVVREVVDYYNDPCSEIKTNSQKMRDMLRFVQDYYYCNRIKKAEESADEHMVR